LCAGLLIGAGGWLASRSKESGGGAPTQESSRSWDTTHEKVFLAEQLRRNPTHVPILLRLAQMERSEGNLRGARQHLEQAVATDSNQVDVRLELGLVCSEMGDLAAAEEQNRAVLRIEPGQSDALYNLGAIFADRGDFVQARRVWTDAIRGGNQTDGAAQAEKALQRLEHVR